MATNPTASAQSQISESLPVSLNMHSESAKEVLLCALPGPEPKSALDRLRSDFPQLDVRYAGVDFDYEGWRNGSTIPDELWEHVVVLCTVTCLPTNMSVAPKLQLVHLISASGNHLERSPIYTGSDVVITSSSGIHGPPIAEWCLMTRLVMSHRYDATREQQKCHRWLGVFPPGNDATRGVSDLVGRRIGIFGYGSIGRQMGRVAKAMGMTVIAYTASPKNTPEERRDTGFVIPGTGDPEGVFPSEWYSGLTPEDRRKFLAQNLDWLVIAAPLTKETHRIFGMNDFKLLSRGGHGPAFITNIARGAILNQPELIEALKNGTVAGAALDVTDPEPLPPDSELWDLDNVIISPHTAYLGQEYLERSLQILSLNLDHRSKGEEMLNVIQRTRGY